MSLLARVAALEATEFRSACGLPPREELASPAAFAAALVVCGKHPDPAWNLAANQTDDHKVPANSTDQVQPVDDGLGRQIKQGMGLEEEEWLEDDENLQKYEDNELTASDRRILIANWYCKGYKRAVESSAMGGARWTAR